MKSKILILGAVVAAFTFTSFAADALLSPRATGNQVKVVATTANDITLVATPGTALLSPRAAGNQIVTATGAEAVAVKCPVFGSPKYVAAAGTAARTSCCGLTLAQCPTMNDMPKSN
jgi:hypothetical protein